MNEQELDTLLKQLAAKQVAVPDLRHAVWMEIDRRSRAVTFTANLFAKTHMALLFPASILAAVIVGISVPFAMPAPPPNNPQAEAAQALHLDIFTTVPMPDPINIYRQER